MSDYVDSGMQIAPLEDVDSIDWAALAEKILLEPWLEDFDSTGYYELGRDPGAEAASGVRCEKFPSASIGQVPSTSIGILQAERLSNERTLASTSPIVVSSKISQPTSVYEDDELKSSTNKPTFKCDFRGCKSKPCATAGDLRRHKRKHDDTKERYSCMAHDCPRKGKNGFYREDKLTDHIIAAHDNDTLFTCPDQHYSSNCSGKVYSRDIMALHYQASVWGRNCMTKVNGYRDCPLPKCPYRIYLARRDRSLDPLQRHLVEHHDSKGRANFAGRILGRGYDAMTGEIVCPVCLEKANFSDHSKFYHHFFEAHYQGPPIEIEATTTISSYRDPVWSLILPGTFVSGEVRQCRRTILSLWPDFKFYPVWDDVEHSYTSPS
ncbi:hypothetical protein K505DRAFT_377320 [Melanomma pulvis-pyrius CBS 109.77]|uniref:C2H2-type domain-containing protein n=1 Tax=Melanomma pulvis-pyrius CBS 109.77 TaxID=1314802 RepID=A0A6A6X2Y3_9PLEO|nr:hypothetical protein K505DRAFT_377320 [Melanomma pulvis-pyrius CBS 109.77]